MKAEIKGIFIGFTKQESKSEAGRYFGKITLEQDGDVLTLSCNPLIEDSLKDKKYKPVSAVLVMSEFNGKLSLKIDSII